MKKATLILLAGLALASAKDALSQTVSGYITDLFNNQPIDSALVQIENFGTDTTDENGFYSITSSGVSPYIIIPNNTPKKLEIVNILGQRILDKDISLDDIVGNKLRIDNLQNVASGIYPFKISDEHGKPYASGLIPIIEGSNVSLVPFSIVEPKRSNGGRSINDVDDYKQFVVSKEGYLLRETWIEEPIGNIIRDEGIVPNSTSEDSLFIEFFNDVCQRGVNSGTKRWLVNPTIYIDTTEVNSGMPATQTAIDNYLNAVANLNEFTLGTITGNYLLCDSLPAENWEDNMFKYWDFTIPFNGTVGYVWDPITREVYHSGVSIKFFTTIYGIYLEEVTQATGPINNSMIITPSVFNNGGANEYTETDLKVGKWLFSRPPNNKVPDKDPFPN